MSSQFYRVETFSLSPKTGWSAKDVAKEADRQPGHYSNKILYPQSDVLYGISPTHLVDLLDVRLESAFSRVGRSKRKIRKDAQVLMEIVVSYPHKRPDGNYQDWLDLNIGYFKMLYGKNLGSVVQHLDESHPHLHVFVTGDFDKDNCYSLNRVHFAKYLESRSHTKSRSLQFKKGLQRMTDHYYTWVSSIFGMKRKSDNPRHRLNRKEYLQKSLANDAPAVTMNV